MKAQRLLLLIPLLVLLALAAACGDDATPTPTTEPPTPTSVPITASVYVLSNDSPHITEIDAETNQVVATADIPNLGRWTWNDDNNYFDGTNLWAGARNTDTGEAEVILVNLDTLEVTSRIPVGQEASNLYIGKPLQDGRIFIGKHASWQMAIIDTATLQVLEIVDVPTNGEEIGSPAAATCDSDASVGPDGVERIFYPTRDGDTVVALDTSGQTLKIASFPDFRPLMLTVAPDGTVWVQEAKTNTNAVLNPVTLDVLGRFSTPNVPLLASFSPDGKLGYLTGVDTFVTVVDTATYRVLRNVEVGANATKAAAHPNGKYIYVQVTTENSVAVVDTSTWRVVARIDIGVSPNALFIRTR